ncbi:PKD domain-containing protein [Natrialba asiatica]|uniref:Succinylglutamate desuccinylase/aspartoacylase n=1 Tax=Natrialba asiatica (strain ATCC 700177 / DSM 12278 / JCM 9576 / FERM P-10747 / NBRC 102637 / 172P1) TaxID=29540 RepID=M0AU09_NATA1|nr:succinylglutamate desuccinylase/aspartoacylase family protein [Natrialba asiatica]ELZ00864.1 succinylglutamate desuccinylase/aspartoacylase [Natrialba asiatica DSM 12278]
MQTRAQDQSDPGSTDEANLSRSSFTILEGTDGETTVTVTEAPTDGPTVFVIGGIHGNETAGYTAAEEITEWTIDAGTLVTLPRANPVAIERTTRVDDEGVDLNRQFPEGSDPGTELATAIWDVISEFDPDIVIDLHESRGIYAGDPVDGVGQAIFHSRRNDVAQLAADTADAVNETYIDDSNRAFQTGYYSAPDNDPSGLLVHKASRELNADTFLVETVSTQNELETRVTWHSAIVEHLTTDALFPTDEPDNGHEPDEPLDEEEEPDDPPANENGPDETEPDDGDDSSGENGDDGEDGENGADSGDNAGGDDSNTDGDVPADHTAPTATIRTEPANAADRTFAPDETITLDATCSRAPDGELVSYEWSIQSDGTYDESGQTVDVTVSATGEHRVLLRVTDDAGARDTTELTLTVN